MSKGSIRRKSKVNREIVDLRYLLAFGNDQEKQLAKQRLIELNEIKDDSHTVNNHDILTTSNNSETSS